MPRCASAKSLVFAAFAVAALASALPAQARNFPFRALRGQIAFGAAPPAIKLNGKDAQLAPGVRIHGQDNMLKVTSAVTVGQKYDADYVLEESTGLVAEVWLLTSEEAKVHPWPTTPAQQQSWRFDPAAQVWTLP